MLRIKKFNLIGLGFLFFGFLLYIYALLASEENIIVYISLLVCLTMALLLNNRFELISPAVLFTAYYIYSVAIGPIVLMNMGRFYSYGYTKIILGGLLAFACGNAIFLLLTKRNITVRKKTDQRFVFLFQESKRYIFCWLFHGLQRFIIL